MEQKIKVTLVERMSGTFMTILNISKENQIHYLKCKLGIEFLLVNLYKLILIYLLAALLKIIPLVLLFHISFLSIRGRAQGAHASSDLKCVVLSLGILVGIPYLISLNFIAQKEWLFFIFCIGIITTFFYAPSDSPKNPIKDSIQRKRLRRKALTNYSLLSIIFVLPVSIVLMNLVIIGAFVAAALLIPMLHKIL